MIMMARVEHAEGNYTAAEAGFKAALASASTPGARVNAWSALLLFHRVQGQTTAALDALAHRFEAAAAVVPPTQLVAQRLSNLEVYFDTGREAEVRALIDEHGAQLPVPFNVVAAIAELQLALENRDVAAAEARLAAVESLIAANQMENLRGAALSAGAQLAGLKGEWERACALRQDVLRANPTDPFVHISIAECLRELGRLPEAEEAIRLALKRTPGSARAHVELARVLQARGDAAGARAALERALEMWSLAEPDFEPAAEARALLAAAP
jgi:tetratricopeptide (TPR) repeat protein